MALYTVQHTFPCQVLYTFEVIFTAQSAVHVDTKTVQRIYYIFKSNLQILQVLTELSLH